MAQEKGTSWVVKVNVSGTYHPVGKETSNSFSTETAEIDITTKESVGDKESIPGLRSKSLSVEFDYDTAETYNYAYFFDLNQNGTSKTFRLTSGVVGQPEYTFSGWIKSISRENPNEDKVTCSMEIAISGAVTVGTTS